MGQGISVDADAMELKEFFRMGQAAAGAPPQALRGHAGTVAAPGGTGHHIKAWKFDARGRAVVDSPVELRDESGLFSAELERNSSYLILHVRPACASGSPDESQAPAKEALEELAATAGASCTPRGLAIEVASSVDPVGGGATALEAQVVPGLLGAAVRYAVFVWHGLGVDPLVKAHTMGKAFELDRLLKHGLLRQPTFVDGLRRAVTLKGASRLGAALSGDRGAEGLEPSRPGRNRLLSSLSDGAGAGRQQAGAGFSPRPPGGPPTGGHRFPRLGLSVCRSLGVTLPAAAGWGRDQRWAQAPPSLASKPPPISAPPPGVASLPLAAAAPLPASAAPPGTTRVGKGILIPRLALGALSIGGPATAPAPGPGPMDVDDSSGASQDSCDGSGRKRMRGGSEPQPAPCRPPSARGAPAAQTLPLRLPSGPPLPQTAREALSFANQPPAAAASDNHAGMAPKGILPSLNLAALAQRGQPPPAALAAQRADAPAMLNLEEIHMSEEELISAYDPDNEENNYHLPHHLYKQLQLKHFRQVCSEVIPGKLFISSYQVACSLDSLKRAQITHIVNTAADVCDNNFPEHFRYLTYYLKDVNSEDISSLFYRTLEWVQAAMDSGGRVLVHCREGVSRSATMIIAYLMWRFNLSFDAAHERIRKVRPVCNPNTGFTCQLLLLGKKLGVSGCPGNGNAAPDRLTPSDRAQLHRVAPYHPKEPFLIFVPVEWPTTWPLLDSRFGWVVQRGSALMLWIGSQVPDAQAVRDAARQHVQWLQDFERCQRTLIIVDEGNEPEQFWEALNAASGPPPVPAGQAAQVAGPRACYDADHELLLSLAGSPATRSAAPGCGLRPAADAVTDEAN